MKDVDRSILDNGWGGFSEAGREYVIRRPDTPKPWVNVISWGDHGLVVSQAGGGYSWRTHASLNRITRWEQDLVKDEWGKFVYLRDQDSGALWSAAWKPVCGRPKHYACHHGQGYTAIRSVNCDVESVFTVFVPPDAPLEVWVLRLRNLADRPRRLWVGTYLEWLLGSAPDWHREFHRTFISCWFDPETGAILAEKRLWELPGAGWNQGWGYVAFHA
ncbi:MAG: glycosyl transferase family 36, partial [Candidatus Bipolaricaulota bacterium]